MRPVKLLAFGALLIRVGCLDAHAEGSSTTLSEKPVLPAAKSDSKTTKLKTLSAEAANARAQVPDPPRSPATEPAPGKIIDRSGSHDSLRLSEHPVPLLSRQEVPTPTPPLIEWNEKFLQPGNLKPGFELPTGAVWQPSLWVFGDYFATAGYVNDGVNRTRAYLSNRLDLTANLKLTPTERVVLGISPLTRGADHTGFLYRRGQGTDFIDGISPNVTSLFFEGEIGELFPNLDPNDSKGYDIGFAIGRQPVLAQEGVMINASLDAVALTRDTIIIPNVTQDMRITAMAGGDFRRSDNLYDNTAYLFGLFTETDLRKTTINLDMAYVSSDSARGGDTVNFGFSAAQRFGALSTTFRINSSTALENSGSAAGNGVLFLAETNRTMPGSNDIVYLNAFETIGTYTSAARGPLVGGPLARVGVLFSAPTAGLAGSPISNRASKVAGGALGYQRFFDDNKTQVTVELAGRKDTNGVDEGVAALAGRYLRALDNRTSIQFDAFVSAGEDRRIGTGLSAEWRLRL